MSAPGAERPTTTHVRTDPAPSRVRLLTPAAIALLAIGTVMAIAGILVAPLFLPGTYVITASLALLAAAGIAGATATGDHG